MAKETERMIDEFQCVGCTLGSSPCQECPSFAPGGQIGFNCTAHSAGTLLVGAGYIYLGLPKGFNKVGAFRVKGDEESTHNIRLFIHPDMPEWDHLNVPVWAMERDGYLFVRTFLPRIGANFIDVIKGGTLGMVHEFTVDVAEFIDAID